MEKVGFLLILLEICSSQRIFGSLNSGSYSNLMEAIEATEGVTEVELTFTGDKKEFLLDSPAVISNRLNFTGTNQILVFASNLTISRFGRLCISNLTITIKKMPFFDFIMQVEGNFSVKNTIIRDVFVSFISLFGSFSMFDTEISNLNADFLSINGENTDLKLEQSVMFDGENASFVRILHTNKNAKMNFEANSCVFRDNLGSLGNPLFDLWGNIGTFVVKNTIFEGNSGVLFSISGSNLTKTVQNCEFRANIGLLYFGYLQNSFFTFTSLKFTNNTDISINFLQFTGYFQLTDSIVTNQNYKGLFRFISDNDIENCEVYIGSTEFRDFEIAIFDDTPGLLHLDDCVGRVWNVTVENVLVLSLIDKPVNTLIGGVLSILYISHISIINSGTVGYVIAMNIGTIYLSDFIISDPHSGEGIFLGVSDGLLWVRNGTFTGGYLHHYNVKRLFEYNCIYIAGLVSTLRIDNITIHSTVNDMGMAFAAFQSQFQVFTLIVDGTNIDSAFVTSHSRGSVSNMILKDMRMDMDVVQLGCGSNVSISHLNLTNIHILPTNRAVFQASMRSLLDLNHVFVSNLTVNGVFRVKQSQVNANFMTFEESSLGLFLNNPLFSDIFVSFLEIKSCKLQLFFATESKIIVSNSVFSDISASGTIFGSVTSDIYIKNTRFLRVFTSGDIGKLIERSEFVMENVTFGGIYAKGEIGWRVFDSIFTVRGSKFDNFDCGLVDSEFSSITLETSSFTNIHNPVKSLRSSAAYGGLVGCVDCKLVSLTGVSVENVTAVIGGAVSVRQVLRQDAHLEVKDSLVVHCTATNGGALYIQSVAFTISTCAFKGNSATNYGGALDIDIRSWQWGLIRNSTFIGNTAKEGGGVKWHNAEVYLSQVRFLANRADYGPDIASYGVAITQLPSNLRDNEVSGSPLSLLFAFLDHYGQKVTISPFKAVVLTTTDRVSYRGNQIGVLSNGLFNFSLLTIYAPPASTQLIEAVLTYSQGDYDLRIVGNASVTFRDCVSGEIRRKDRCDYCYPGNVSFHPSDSDCSFCPAHADCPGGNRLLVDSGYWRNDSSSLNILKCLLPTKCTGGENSTCLSGHTGPLCTQCAQGWTRVRVIDCVQCPHFLIISLQFLSILTLWGLILWATVRLNQYGSRLFLVKSLVHYMQFLHCLAYLRVEYSPAITLYFRLTSLFSSLLIPDFPLSCLSLSVSDYSLALLGSCLFPVLFLLSALIYRLTTVTWVAHSLLFSFSSLLFSPFIVLQTLLPLFSCGSIDSSSPISLFNDLNNACWTGTHLKFVYLLLIPSIVVNICVPFLLILTISVFKKQKFKRFIVFFKSGHRIALWDLYFHTLKLALLTILGVTRMSPPLAQSAYSLSLLIVTCVVNVTLHEVTFESKKLFFVAETGIVTVTLANGVLSYYTRYKAGEMNGEIGVNVMFFAVNGVYLMGMMWVLLTKQGNMWVNRKEIRENSVVLVSQPPVSEANTPFNTPQASFSLNPPN